MDGYQPPQMELLLELLGGLEGLADFDPSGARRDTDSDGFDWWGDE